MDTLEDVGNLSCGDNYDRFIKIIIFVSLIGHNTKCPGCIKVMMLVCVLCKAIPRKSKGQTPVFHCVLQKFHIYLPVVYLFHAGILKMNKRKIMYAAK